jgi:hypothetical protein
VKAGIPDFRSPEGLFQTLKRDHPRETLCSGKDLFDASVFNVSSLLLSVLSLGCLGFKRQENDRFITISATWVPSNQNVTSSSYLYSCFTLFILY